MKMQEKKLKKFNIYSKLANILFVLAIVFGSILVIVALGGTIYLKATDFNIAELVNYISLNTMPDVGLLLPEGFEISFSLIFIIIVYLAISIALAAYIIKLVANMFRNTVSDQTPFTKKTVRSIKNMGIAFLVYAGVIFILSIVVGYVTPHPESMSFNVTIDGRTILLGFLLLSLGEIFEFGHSLQKDTESIV